MQMDMDRGLLLKELLISSTTDWLFSLDIFTFLAYIL